MIISLSNINFGGGSGGGGEYHLPVATATRLGGIKVGSGLTITNDGILSSEGGGDVTILKSVSELPASAETGDIVAYEGSESYPNGITFSQGTNEGTFTIPLGSLDDYTMQDPLVLGTVRAVYGDDSLGTLLTIYAYTINEGNVTYVLSPSSDGNLADPDLNIYMGETETDTAEIAYDVMFDYSLVGQNMVVDIYHDSESSAVGIEFDDVITGGDPMGVYQYDGTQWQRIGNGGGAGDALVPVSELPASAETGEVVAYQYTVTGNTPHNYSIDEQDGSHFGFVVEYLDPETYHTSENPMHLGRIVSPNASGMSGCANFVDLYVYYDSPTTPPTFRYVDSNGDDSADYLQPRCKFQVDLDGPYIQQDDNQILFSVYMKAAINDGVITVGITGESSDSSSYQSDLELVNGIDEGGEPYSKDYVEVRQYDGTQWLKSLVHFTAATDSDMEALSANDGDVCYVAAHYGPVYELWEQFFNYNWSLQDVATNYRSNYGVDTFKLTLVENPYWDGVSEYVDAYDNWEKDGAPYGFSSTTENGGSFYCFSGSSTPVVMTTGDSMVIDTDFVNFGYSNDFFLFEHSNNTTPKYVLKAEQIVEAASYFNQNGSWIKLASEDKVNEAYETAQNALNQAASKFGYQRVAYNSESDVLPNIKYYQSGAYDVTIYSQPTVQKGILFHKNGSDTEDDNKYLRELVTSKSVMKIVALTQSEYDALEQAGQLVSTTLYAIIPEQV